MTARATMTAILPYDPAHLAQLHLQAAQIGEAERFGKRVGDAAEHGPAFTAAETDLEGGIVRVLGCAGLFLNAPDYATAWAVFAEGLRPSQWSALTAAIRRVLDASEFRRIDTLVRGDFPAAHRYARALGFEPDATIYARISAPLLNEAHG
jgi:hypothetical protein